MKKLESDLNEKIISLRHRALTKIKPYYKEKLDRPVSFWIKEDRLLHEIGKEFTIILRTKGCNWALGTSGGCSMCGYIQDANIEKVKPEQILNQFDYAINSKLDEIRMDNNNYVLKIFNSGSFFDETEIAQDIRTSIYEKIIQASNFCCYYGESNRHSFQNRIWHTFRIRWKHK